MRECAGKWPYCRRHGAGYGHNDGIRGAIILKPNYMLSRLPACRHRLAAAVEGHGQLGCTGLPTFGMESVAPGAGPTLVMRCNGCTCVHVVV